VHRDLVRQPFSAAIYEHVRARSAAAGEPVRDDYIARRVAEMLDPGRSSDRSKADTRMVAKENNNPPRPPRPGPGDSAPTGDDPAGRTTDHQGADTSEEPGAGSARPTSRRRHRGRAVVGFGVFDPTSDDWGLR
jgi:hypothetical protein